MSDRQTEQERDAAVIDPAAMIREMASMMIVYPHYHDTYNRAIRTIDRLTAERDAARKNESRWRERINAIIAIAESYECLAQNPDVETSVSQERIGFAQDIYQALGIESEADHD